MARFTTRPEILGTFGVAQALSAANALSSLEQLQVPLLFTAAMTVCFLLAGYMILRRT